MQACASDVVFGEVDVRHVRCVVLDEAHCAKDDHFYNQLVQLIDNSNTKYRLMGLSTALANNASALEVLTLALTIEAIECRTAESPDVRCYMPSLVLCKLTHDLYSTKRVIERVR